MGGIGVTWRFRIAKWFVMISTAAVLDFLLLAHLELCSWSPYSMVCWSSSIVSSPGALHLVSLFHSLLTMVRPSPVCPLVTFHIFDIFIRMVSMMAAMAAILKVFKLLSAPEQVGWSVKLVEGIGATLRFRIAKMVLFWYPRWPPWQPSWIPSKHISYQMVSLIELKHDGRHWGVMEVHSC